MKLAPIQKILFNTVKENFKKTYDADYKDSYKKLKFIGIELDKKSCYENSSSLYNSVTFIVRVSLYGEEILYGVTLDSDGIIVGCYYIDEGNEV
jgi:hypothetical protein